MENQREILIQPTATGVYSMAVCVSFNFEESQPVGFDFA